ncbi:MAG: DUF2235 domain-containing protein [SAR324 cluster bacterium]|nr:DUF2235 domain-containing protein [SAR324 cluster bacterium]
MAEQTGKNLVVFSDGTGKEGGESPNSNVYKLFNMVEDRTERQIAFYDRGLGTGWRKLSGMAAGRGISQNIRECYQFIFDNYQAGDKIYLFGFSRGAYTVRSLGGFISLFGMLPKSRPELIEKAYKIYKIANPNQREKRAHIFLSKHHTMRSPIELIGVWDTVGALGLPFKTLDLLNPLKHKFHDTTLSPSIKYGFHALAIDDERLTFHPTFWNERKIEDHQTIEQVWFAGMHTDVGGGYEEQQLSDIALQWMVRKAEGAGLHIYPKHKVRVSPDPDGKMHNSRKGLLGGLYRKKQRNLDDNILRAKVHASVMQRKPDRHNNPHNKYHPWILDGPHEMVS